MRMTRVLKSQAELLANKASGGRVVPRKATELLAMQHRDVDALFARVKRTKDGRTRRALIQELADKLAGHMVIEREIFYPACAAQPKLRDMIFEALEEHGVAEYELRRVLASGVADEAFDARFTVLVELIQHHVKEEESELFGKAERALGRERMISLGEEMAKRFEKVTTRGTARRAAGSPAVTATLPRSTGAKRAAAKRRSRKSP